jgi:UDP-N-acetylmuramoyl-L-alanyl-D-glutamate--2,6-diaminopimelate ligase
MSVRSTEGTAAALADVLEAAEPGRSRPLGQLVERLANEGRLRAIVRADALLEATAVAGLEIGGISDDSRRLRSGDVFVAIRGARTDGHDRLAAAVASGAVAAIVEHPVASVEVIQVVVERSPAALGSAAAWWYGDPTRDLAVVGVTGTDGKTTTSFLAAAALEAAGLATGLVGTVETRVGPVHAPTPGHVTTPGALELQRLLRAMVAGGDRAAVIETTSHGLAAERVSGVAYDAAIFTNLTHEHLEFHGTFEAYRAAKVSLFERLGRPSAKTAARPRVGVVNADDAAADRFAAATRTAGARLVTYGQASDADVRAGSIAERGARLRMAVVAPGWTGELALRLAGRFNVHNALAAVALGIGWELDPEAVRAGLEGLTGVPGRMERIERGQPFTVIVDFAHSPAALQGVLDELGPVAAAAGGGLIAVFGSAGERDTAKRPMMGRIAGERCRLVVLTDEDPRSEDRLVILDEIAVGAEAAGRRRGRDLLLIPDRATAIADALGRARPGDVIVFAGKGHETTIEGPDGPLSWDERAAVEHALAALGFRDGD